MLNMVKGCKVHDATLLHEGYQRIESRYVANVNAEKIQVLLERFITIQDSRIFLILEIPTNAKDEVEIEPGVFASMHMDVYYLDGLTKESAISFLHTFGPLFIQDGMCKFGFGAHSGNNEIVLDYYNVVTIHTNTPEQYDGMFEGFGIMQVPDLKTAWDYFTDDTPGECSKVSYCGKDIYDIAEYLQQYGLYFAERREKF